MPSGDRKVAQYLKELAINRALCQACVVSDNHLTLLLRGLTGSEQSRVKRAIDTQQLPDVSVRVKIRKGVLGR